MLELNQYYNMDCMEGMKQFPDKYFDLALVDPEYGRGEDGGRNRSKFVKQKSGSSLYVPDGGYEKEHWDQEPVGPEYFEELFRVSKHQIIWGENYYTEQFGPGRIIWDKCNDGSDQSDCEIAYNSLTDRVDIFRFMWRGMMQGKSIAEGHTQQGNKKLNEKRFHPAQKPTALYRWCLMKYCIPGWKILDTHVGSASSLVACYDLGYDFIGFEENPRYYTKGSAWLQDVKAQVRMII
jgi:site-specific DNA-methyltransferase (adenine-specific)